MLLSNLLAGSVFAGELEPGDFQVNFKVVDDFGKPVPMATVGVSFLRAITPWMTPTIHNTEKKQIDAITDTNGEAIIKGSNLLDKTLYYGMNPLSGYY